ncbi:hypothetical protein ARMGADRAFT_460605 [Armillaria gallica]|uniref:Secreted protein n=1 Tax=Armillaria gallica TaxID=47427 RepID=A0A2H3CX23_ARMGA|nr:hypothetical protein ARMGADRAFT_460605 [Armillaria gallica]
MMRFLMVSCSLEIVVFVIWWSAFQCAALKSLGTSKPRHHARTVCCQILHPFDNMRIMQQKDEDAYTYLDMSLLTNVSLNKSTAPIQVARQPDTISSWLPPQRPLTSFSPDVRDFLLGHSGWEQ